MNKYIARVSLLSRVWWFEHRHIICNTLNFLALQVMAYTTLVGSMYCVGCIIEGGDVWLCGIPAGLGLNMVIKMLNEADAIQI